MLVSCIMPTNNRRAFIPMALSCFLAQDWPERELIVVDDGTDAVEDLFRGVPGVRYFFYREPGLPAHRPNTPIGTKRNFACEKASGDIILHWDDDDWSDPHRITDQIARLLTSGKDVTGYNELMFYDLRSKTVNLYPNCDPAYSCGTALCYRKQWWAGHRFEASSFGEDTQFSGRAKSAGQLFAVPAEKMMVALTHPKNSCERSSQWPKKQVADLPAGFLTDFSKISNQVA